MSESQPPERAAGRGPVRPSEDPAAEAGPRESAGGFGNGATPPNGGAGELRPLAVSSVRVILWGELGWVLALAVILAVPALHEGERHWWPWVPVAGLAIGLFGLAYVRRGRGNAAGAD